MELNVIEKDSNLADVAGSATTNGLTVVVLPRAEDKLAGNVIENSHAGERTEGKDSLKMIPQTLSDNDVRNGLFRDRSPSKASKNWRKIRTTVAANNAFQKVANNNSHGKIHRQMNGTKAAIAVLSLPLAVFLLICNCLIPGLGTIISSFMFCCKATTYDKTERDQLSDKIPGLFVTNFCVGLAQLLTVPFLLVGWFWSISWGMTMVYLAQERRFQ